MNDLQPINFPGLDPRRPLVIAGPCSAETEEQVIETARELAAEGFKLFRAGLWKPRTKPGGFEGVGVDGIAWLQRVKRETGMYTATEVATRKHVLAALEGGIDMIWIGARTTANPFAMQEIADALRGHDIPVLVKNPVSPDLELWIGGVERIYNAGIRRLGVIHRGFTSIDKSLYRNHPMWSIPIELHRRLPGLQIFCDPSHLGGGPGGGPPPPTQADAVEALLAAVYLDGGIGSARKLITRFILTDNRREQGGTRDYKTALQELVQRESGQVLSYRLTGESGPDHAKVFAVEVELNGAPVGAGEGRSKKEAEQMAAKAAIQKLSR